MPIRYEPDYEAHIAFIKGIDTVTFDDCVQLIRDQEKDVGKRLHELNDYRGIKLHIKADQIEALAGLNRDLYANVKDIRFAVVVDTGLGYGMSRMFDVYLDNTVEFQIFEDYDEALRWVEDGARRDKATSKIR
jgi:hypothetical protein